MTWAWIPNGVSLMNLFMGFFSIEKIGEGRFEEAFWWIALALICDSLDGNIARIFKTSSELGKELDSLGDVVSFIVAPALLVLKSWPYPGTDWMQIVLFFYLGCGAYRLARFNINTSPTVQGYFRGLPTPATAILVVSTTVGLEKEGLAGSLTMTIVHFSWIAFLGFLMISNVMYPKITAVRFRQWRGLFFASAVFFALAYRYLNTELAIAVPFLLFVLFGFMTRQDPPKPSVLETARRKS